MNQEELGEVELKAIKSDDIVDAGKISANTITKLGNLMAYCLFLLPKNWVAYDPQVDDKPSHADRIMKINLRRLENKSFHVDAKTGLYEYRIW